jgi:hypothetical protein
MIEEPLHGTAADEMLMEYGIGILDLDVAIPNVFRVDDYHGAVPALIHAARIVDANRCLEPR